MNEETYTMNVQISVIEDLGERLYTDTAAALSELVANAWDADAEKIHLNQEDNGKTLLIQDDGFGMSETDLNEKYLVSQDVKENLSTKT